MNDPVFFSLARNYGFIQISFDQRINRIYPELERFCKLIGSQLETGLVINIHIANLPKSILIKKLKLCLPKSEGEMVGLLSYRDLIVMALQGEKCASSIGQIPAHQAAEELALGAIVDFVPSRESFARRTLGDVEPVVDVPFIQQRGGKTTNFYCFLNDPSFFKSRSILYHVDVQACLDKVT